MKTTKLFILLAVVAAVFSASVSAQEKAKSGNDKNTAKSAAKADKKKADKTDRVYLLGAKGGCYYLTDSGKKSYVDKENCAELTQSSAPAAAKKPDAESADKTAPAIEMVEGKSTDAGETDSAKPVKDEASAPKPATATASSTAPIAPATAAAAPTETETEDKKMTKTEPAKKADADDKKYIKGARGGCYYLTESGRKVYVKDKSLCEN